MMLSNAKEIYDKAKKYNNTSNFLETIYKIKSSDNFDAIIIAPSWLPERILVNYKPEVCCLVRHSYFSSYSVKFDGIHIAWIQCASGAGNLIDTVLTLQDSIVDKIIFIGAAGSLKHDIKLGQLSTPLFCHSYVGATFYLNDELNAKNYGEVVYPHNQDFIKAIVAKAYENNINLTENVVFCTDSIICEYQHLEFIKTLNAELIEMETSAFYMCMKLINKNGIALLCVSDNSAANISLVNRTIEESKVFHASREVNIPELIKIICKS